VHVVRVVRVVRTMYRNCENCLAIVVRAGCDVCESQAVRFVRIMIASDAGKRAMNWYRVSYPKHQIGVVAHGGIAHFNELVLKQM
jgi:hypothetical protein